MDERQIEKLIQDADNKYEIKTTASSILQAYEAQVEVQRAKRHKKRRIWLLSSLLTTCTAATVLAVVIPNVVAPPSSSGVIVIPPSVHPVVVNPQEGVIGGTRSQTAFQVYSGVSLLTNLEEGTDISTLRKGKKNMSESDFAAVVEAFDHAYDNIEHFITGQEYEIDNIIEKGVFPSTDKHVSYYTYRMTIDSSIVFLTNESFEETDDDEVETVQKGEIIADDGLGNYFVEIEKEKKIDESEVDITIKRKGYELKISHEDEEGEREYEYQLKVDGQAKYSEKISWEFEEADENEDQEDNGISIAIENEGKKFKFEQVTFADSLMSAVYEYEGSSGKMSIAVEESSRVYKEETNGYIVVKSAL